MYSTVQSAVYNVDCGHLKSLDLARESKTFLDSVVRALEFKFLALLLTIKPVSPIFALKQLDFMPAFQLIMHSHKDVSLMQFHVNARLFYNIAK